MKKHTNRARSQYKLVTPVLRRLKRESYQELRSAWAAEQKPASIKQKSIKVGRRKWWEGRKNEEGKDALKMLVFQSYRETVSPKNVCIKITVINYLNISKIPDILFVIKKNCGLSTKGKRAFMRRWRRVFKGSETQPRMFSNTVGWPVLTVNWMFHNRQRGIWSALIDTLYVMWPLVHIFTLGQLERKIF